MYYVHRAKWSFSPLAMQKIDSKKIKNEEKPLHNAGNDKVLANSVSRLFSNHLSLEKIYKPRQLDFEVHVIGKRKKRK